MKRLALNLEALAALRALRTGSEPDPAAAVVLAEMAGVSGVMVPYRGENGPVRQRDLELAKAIIKTHFNCVVHADTDRLGLILKVMPEMVTLADLDPHGLDIGSVDVLTYQSELTRMVTQLRDSDIIVTLMVEPELDVIKAAARTGADYVQLNSVAYAVAPDANQEQAELDRLAGMAAAAAKLGMSVTAGGGLLYRNIREVAAIPQIEELMVGHALCARAMLAGMDTAVRDMLNLVAGE